MMSRSYSSREKQAASPVCVVAAHPQAIEVDARLVLDDQRAVAERREVVGRALIDRGGIRIRAGGSSSSGARDAEEADCGLSVGKRARLVGADDIVGNGGDAGRVSRLRTQRTERMERRHGAQSNTSGLGTWGLRGLAAND